MISIFGIDIFLVHIHLATLFFLIVVILFADKEALSWMRGEKQVLSERRLILLHRLMWTGLSIMIITGIFMFLPLRDYLLSTPAFYTKMIFVLALIINGLFIGRFMRIAARTPFNNLSKAERRPLFISGAVSTISWAGAIISALLMGL